MFHPTRPLLKRTPLRLLGFRRPAIRALRAELAPLSPAAQTVPFPGPDRAPRRQPPLPGASDAAVLGRRFSDLLSGPGPRRWRRARAGSDRWSAGAASTTARWAHSVYAFDRRRLQVLPLATPAVLRGLAAHLDMLPRRLLAHLPPDAAAAPRALFRAFVSDRGRTCGLRQDVVGKLKRARRAGFWRVLRGAMAWEPAVAFRHYQGGGVEMRAFAHDPRIEALREEAGRLRREMLRRLRVDASNEAMSDS
jgi:hypothetical protein